MRAIDARGREAVGRSTIHLANNHFRARAFGDRFVPVAYDRFPKRVAQRRRFTAQLRNIESDALLFTAATLPERSCLAGHEDRTRSVPLAALGVPERIAAKAVTNLAVTLPDGMVGKDICVAELELTGDSDPPRTGTPMPGSPIAYRPASLRFTFELQAAPSVEQGGAPELAPRPVTDPAQLANLQRAREVLGHGRITPSELQQLDLEGSLELPPVAGGTVSARGAPCRRAICSDWPTSRR